MDVYRAALTSFNSNGRDRLLFIIIVCCIVGNCIAGKLFRFQNQH